MTESSQQPVLEQKHSGISFENDALQWKDLTAQTKHSVPIDNLIAILPISNAETENDVTTPGLTALYLDRHDGDKIDNVQLKTLSLPESLLNEDHTAKLKEYHLPRIPAHLQSRTNVHVVISTRAGTQCALPFFEKALQPLLESVSVSGYNVHKTESAQTILELCAREFVPRAKEGAKQTIILLSGDGGVVDVIKAFSDCMDGNDGTVKCSSTSEVPFTPPTLCVIPMGTGNATANSAGLASDSTLGLSSLMCGEARAMPTFRVTLAPGTVNLAGEGRREELVSRDVDGNAHVIYGAVVLSWGMHASLVADSDTDEYRKFGTDRFKMAAKELLWPSDGSETHRYKGKVNLTMDRGESEENEAVNKDIDRSEHMYVLITLASQLEKGFMISPASKLLDGKLRIVHFGPVPSDRAMEMMGLAYQGGKHIWEPEVGYTAVEKVRIDFHEEVERWRRICIDGKIVAVPQGGWLQVEKEKREFLRLVVRGATSNT